MATQDGDDELMRSSRKCKTAKVKHDESETTAKGHPVPQRRFETLCKSGQTDELAANHLFPWFPLV
jgi:hypothetical protein